MMTLTVAMVLCLGIISSASALTMNGGKCLGFQTEVTFCRFLLMPNGDFVPNKNWTEGAFSVPSTETGYTASAVKVLEGIDSKDRDRDRDKDNDSDGDDGDSRGNQANPYCDKVSDEYMESGGYCHDRRDYEDGGPNNGLYPCNDGSYLTDWRDCPDVSGFDYNSNNNDNSEEEDDDKTANCGGEPCTPREKEDSWTDDEGICYANDNGALGERVPCV